MEGIVMESVWVAVGFAAFVALVWKKVGQGLSGMLDERSAKIKSDLDEAAALREAALEEMHQLQRLQREAAAEAKAILKTAEATAERITATAAKNAEESVKRREAQATAKIKAAEVAMVNELRDRAASLAVATATEIISTKLDEKASLALVDTAAAEIEKLN